MSYELQRLVENDQALFASDAEKKIIIANCQKVIEWMYEGNARKTEEYKAQIQNMEKTAENANTK